MENTQPMKEQVFTLNVQYISTHASITFGGEELQDWEEWVYLSFASYVCMHVAGYTSKWHLVL